MSNPSPDRPEDDGYELLDSGFGRKLERFGDLLLDRPCGQAVWKPGRSEDFWKTASAVFDRKDGMRWSGSERLPNRWSIRVAGIEFLLSGTDFGHLGIFPEQRTLWRWIRTRVREAGRTLQVLNLFAYSGGSTLAAAMEGAHVCHLDASKGMVAWARENAAANGLSGAPIRWIIDDVLKFLKREIRRGVKYDAIILDPPTFGRGKAGEVFQVEAAINPLLEQCGELLSDRPDFFLLTCHTPGFTPVVLENLVTGLMNGKGGRVACGEMVLTGGAQVLPVPSGTFARWTRE